LNPIDEAVVAIDSRNPEDKLVYQEYANFFGVKRVMSRRHQGYQVPREAKERETHPTTRG
jgi:hypothetical protein